MSGCHFLRIARELSDMPRQIFSRRLLSFFFTGVRIEGGNLLQTIVLSSTQRTIDIPTAFLNQETNFGTIEWTFEDGAKGHIAVAMEALGRFSVGYGAACQD